jgi:hypothetical protein
VLPGEPEFHGFSATLELRATEPAVVPEDALTAAMRQFSSRTEPAPSGCATTSTWRAASRANTGDDPIGRLVAKIPSSDDFFDNATPPVVAVDANRSPERIVKQVFAMTGFAARYRILECREVRIPPGTGDVYTATLVDTDVGARIVLTQHVVVPDHKDVGWLSRIYDVPK